MMPRKLPILFLSLLAALSTAGCKSSQHAGSHLTATPTSSGATVPVELDDYVIRMPETIPPGDIVLQIRNTGKHVHNIKIAGHGVDVQLPENLKAGESAELRVTLVPGVYHVTCPVGPHATLGMRMDLTVKK
jgi:plastocyanin